MNFNKIIAQLFDLVQNLFIQSSGHSMFCRGENNGRMYRMRVKAEHSRRCDVRRSNRLPRVRCGISRYEYREFGAEGSGNSGRGLGRVNGVSFYASQIADASKAEQLTPFKILVMKIALIHNRVRWEEKRIVKEANALNIDLELINLDKAWFDFHEKLDCETALQRSMSYFRGLHSTAILESNGVEVYESLNTAIICGNKLLTSLKLEKNNVPIPETRIAFSKESALELLEDLGYPAVLKPIYGSWGRLVAALNDNETAKSILEDREFMGSLYSVFYVQERIQKSREIRAFIIGKEVIAANYRYAPKGEWRTNVAIGSRVEPCEITGDIENISLAAAKAVQGKILSIDILESENGLLVNEINSTPEFRGLSSVSKVNIPREILEFVEEEAKA